MEKLYHFHGGQIWRGFGRLAPPIGPAPGLFFGATSPGYTTTGVLMRDEAMSGKEAVTYRRGWWSSDSGEAISRCVNNGLLGLVRRHDGRLLPILGLRSEEGRRYLHIQGAHLDFWATVEELVYRGYRLVIAKPGVWELWSVIDCQETLSIGVHHVGIH